MLTRIAASEYRERPWKNGGGLSHEIAASLSGGDSGELLWSVSIATIERDGAFSDYRGYDRTIVAIGGDPVALHIAGQAHVLHHAEPFAFAGEARVEARLCGAIARDLNVITLRNGYVHDVEIVEGRQRFVLDEDELAFVYAIDGEARVDTASLAQGDALRIEGLEAFDIRAGGRAAVVRITAQVSYD